MKKFRIICLKRSNFTKRTDEYLIQWYQQWDVVYWKPDAMGYTRDIREAGEYSASELTEIRGRWLDWMVEPVWT